MSHSFHDIVEFFTYLTGLVPTEDQKKVLEGIADPTLKRMIISAGRQSGKTLTTCVGVLWWLFESGQKVNILLLSAQDSILYTYIEKVFKEHPELANLAKPSGTYQPVPKYGFWLEPSGNRIFVKGATEKQVRGIAASIVIVDEACEIRNDLILTAMGNLSQPPSKFILLSTPHVSSSYFVKWATDENSGFKTYQWSSENLPWIDSTVQAMKKREMSPSVYIVEVLGRPPQAHERAFFSRADIAKCVLEVEPTPEGKLGSRLEAGFDWGYNRPNPTVGTITERTKTKRKVVAQELFKDNDFEKMAQWLKKYNPAIIRADSLPIEFRGQLEKHFHRSVQYIVAAEDKDVMMTQLQGLIRLHQLIIPQQFTDLVLELERYSKGKQTGDNRVDSLALSCLERAFKETPRCVYFPEKSWSD